VPAGVSTFRAGGAGRRMVWVQPSVFGILVI
jgi:hypothetical protein